MYRLARLVQFLQVSEVNHERKYKNNVDAVLEMALPDHSPNHILLLNKFSLKGFPIFWRICCDLPDSLVFTCQMRYGVVHWTDAPDSDTDLLLGRKMELRV